MLSVLLESLFTVGAVAPVDFPTLKFTPKPNQYLVCRKEHCSETPHRESPVFNEPVEALMKRFAAMLSRQPSLALISDDAALRQRTWVQRTRLVRYPDLITVRFYEAGPGKSTFAVYSRSIYGRSDLGANKKRIDGWLKELGI